MNMKMKGTTVTMFSEDATMMASVEMYPIKDGYITFELGVWTETPAELANSVRADWHARGYIPSAPCVDVILVGDKFYESNGYHLRADGGGYYTTFFPPQEESEEEDEQTQSGFTVKDCSNCNHNCEDIRQDCDSCRYNNKIRPGGDIIAGPCGQQNCWFGKVVCQYNNFCHWQAE